MTIYTVRKWGVPETTLKTRECTLTPAEVATNYADECVKFPTDMDACVIIEVENNGLFYIECHQPENELHTWIITEEKAKKLLAKHMN